jgi:hypothetical protein
VATAGTDHLPLLILPAPSTVDPEGGHGFLSNLRLPDPSRRGLGERFGSLQRAFDQRRLELRAQALNDDPDLVLVLETVGTVAEFKTAVMQVPGLEWLAAWDDDEIEPDEEFYDEEKPGKLLHGKVFLVGSNRAALDDVVRLWERYRDDLTVKLGKNLEAWKTVFRHLKHVRFWGPADRLEPALRQNWRFQVDHGEPSIRFEIEAWHHPSEAKNRAASDELRRLVGAQGGTVLAEAVIGEIAYHGFLVEMPAAGVAQLLEADAAPLLRSDRVMFFRAQGQSIAPDSATDERAGASMPAVQIATGTPVVALLDGLPLANHPLLEGRVLVDDPDGWAADYPVANRVHGTAMASLIALGDLGAREAPLARPIYARPIMQPAQVGGRSVERTPENRLLIDLIHVAVRRMFEPDADDVAAAPGIKVINLSVGDAHRPFMGELSPWARLLDWLQHKHNVLFIVSAGNQGSDLVLGVEPGSLQSMPLERRSALATQALTRSDMDRRLLTPAESVNALTIGASHADTSEFAAVPGRFLLFAEGGVAPYSGVGHGFRRAIKPDFLLPGGRVLYREAPQAPTGQTQLLALGNVPQPPGQLVAAPPTPQGNTLHLRGTSNAAGLGTRWGARAHAVIEALRAGHRVLEPRFDAVLIKALLAHGARLGALKDQIEAARPEVDHWHSQRRLVSRYAGLGIADVERALTCTDQRATMLGVGELRNKKALEFLVPIPSSLHAYTGMRRVTMTLAWFSPINPRHSKYRVARLWADLPDDPLHVTQAREGEYQQLRLGTVHHEVFEGTAAPVIADGQSLRVRVNCKADAGALTAPVQFALCVSLEVAEGVAIQVYNEVRERIAARVGVRPGQAP